MEQDERSIELLIKQLKEQYEEIYVTSFGEVDYIWRALGRQDYKEIQRLAVDEFDAYERVCNAAVLYPEADFSAFSMKAYIPNELAPQILHMSGYGEWKKEIQLLETFRNEMDEFDNQAEVIVATAFPSITFDEMGNWTKEKLMKYLARAEWQLNTLRNINLRLAPASELDAEEGEEVDTTPPKTMEEQIAELAQEYRENGQDPMFTMRWTYMNQEDPYMVSPIIGGYEQTDGMVAGLNAWKDGVYEHGRYARIREQVQKISRR